MGHQQEAVAGCNSSFSFAFASGDEEEEEEDWREALVVERSNYVALSCIRRLWA